MRMSGSNENGRDEGMEDGESPRGRTSHQEGAVTEKGRALSLDSQNKSIRKRPRETTACMICDTTNDDWQLIDCTVCQGEVCPGCSGIDAQMIKSIYFSKLPGFGWTCQACERTKSTMHNMKKVIEENKEANLMVNKTLTSMQANSNARLGALETKLDEMEDRITEQLKAEFPGLIKKELLQVEEKLTMKLQEQINDMEEKVSEKMDKKVKDIEKVVNQIKQNPAQEAEIERRVKEEVRRELERRQGSPTTSGARYRGTDQVSPGTQLRQTVASVTAEMRSREGRRRNMVLYNLEEPEVNNNKELREKADRKKVIDIATNTLGIKDMKEREITGISRLGDKTEDRPRPLKVELTSEPRKTLIFNRLIRLRNTEHDRLSFTHDMTRLEREQQKKLVVEAKRKEAEDGGKSRFRVRGPPWDMRIVKLEKRETAAAEKMEEGEKDG